jgi:hypothetical protein
MQEVLQLFNDFIYTLHLRPDDMPKVISVQKKGIIVVALCLVGTDVTQMKRTPVRYNVSFPSTSDFSVIRLQIRVA